MTTASKTSARTKNREQAKKAGYHIPEIKLTCTVKGNKEDAAVICSMEEAADFFRSMMSKDGMINFREEFYILCLNQGNKVIGYHRISTGGMTGTVADVRIIAQIGLLSCANQMIVAHNHPSGNLQPSQADRTFTEKLLGGLKLLDMRLLDHLIMTDKSYLSMQNEGLM